jgi:hypothetical protein
LRPHEVRSLRRYAALGRSIGKALHKLRDDLAQAAK